MQRPPGMSQTVPSPVKSHRKTSVTSTTLGAIYDTDDEYNNFSVSMGTSLVDALEDAAEQPLSTTSSSRTALHTKRSTSVSSTLRASACNRVDYVLSGGNMTSAARAALGAFVDLMLGGSPALSLLSVEMGGTGAVGDGNTTISSTSPVSNRSLDMLGVPHSSPRPSIKLPPPCTPDVPYTTTVLSLKPSTFSILIDGVVSSSVGSSASSPCDVLALRTSTGVVLLKTAPVGAVMQPSAGPNYSYTPKRITCKKYSGNVVLSGGRVYSLTRGASMCGWLQKWPMRYRRYI